MRLLLMRAVLLCAALCAASAPVSAQETPRKPVDHMSKAYDECAEKSGGVTANILDCNDAEYERLDKKLNAAWQAARKRMPNDAARSALLQQQRDWLKTRWNECSEDEAEGGQAARINNSSCQLTVLNLRINWLESYKPQ